MSPICPKYSTATISPNVMDCNKRIELIHEAQKNIWVDKVNEARVDGRMCHWVSTLHPDRLPGSLDGSFLHGAYNLCQKFTFSDNATWLLCLPLAEATCDQYADEKIAIEVEVLSLIHERTSIPVPTIYSWGVAADNPLGLGAFILMFFIKGTSVNRLLRDSAAAVDTRLMREDISDRDVESLFRLEASTLLVWHRFPLFFHSVPASNSYRMDLN